jgi:hypothetical protein
MNIFTDNPTLYEANSHLASQEISLLLRNPNIHYRVHKRPQLVRMLSQMNLVHNFPHCFPKINFIIVLPSIPRSSEWSLSFRFSK